MKRSVKLCYFDLDFQTDLHLGPLKFHSHNPGSGYNPCRKSKSLSPPLPAGVKVLSGSAPSPRGVEALSRLAGAGVNNAVLPGRPGSTHKTTSFSKGEEIMKRLTIQAGILVIVAVTLTVLTGCAESGGSLQYRTADEWTLSYYNHEPTIFHAVAPLHRSAYDSRWTTTEIGDIGWARQILDRDPGAVNARDADGRTPLMAWAHGRHSMAMGEFLIARGADVNAKDKWGQTALMRMAAWPVGAYGNDLKRPKLKIFDFLIAHGAKVNARDNDGKTALWYAEVECPKVASTLSTPQGRRIYTRSCSLEAITIGRAGGTR